MDATELLVIEGGLDKAKKGTEEWVKAARASARKWTRLVETGYLHLGKLLWEIYDAPGLKNPHLGVYTDWGFDTYDDYVQTELGLHPKKAQRLKLIWVKLRVENGGIKMSEEQEAQLIGLGWSKVQQLVRVLSNSNVDHWLERAKRTGLAGLTVEIAKAVEDINTARKRAEDLGNDPEAAAEDASINSTPEHTVATTKKFTFFDDQFDVVADALKEARRITKFDSQKNNEGQLLSLICTEYVATNDFAKLPDAVRIQHLYKMARFFGFDLVIIDPDKPKEEKIVFGFQNIEKLLDSTGEEEETVPDPDPTDGESG